MTKLLSRFFAFLAAFSLVVSPLATAPLSAQRTQVGSASSVVGSVTMKVNNAGKARKVVRKTRFAWGDMVTTGKKSQLQIMLLDRTTLGVGARSQLRIDRVVYDPSEGRSFFGTLVKGALRFFSGRSGSNSGEVRTPAGRIGIRGTAVDMLVGKEAEDIAKKEEAVGRVRSDKDEATLVVLRGPGVGTEGDLARGIVDVEGAGVTVTLDQPGFAAYIPFNGAAPIGPFRISNAGLAKVQDQMAPEVARAAKGGGLLRTLLPVAAGIGAAVVLGTILSGGDEQNPNTADNPDNDQQRNPRGQDTSGDNNDPDGPIG